MASKIWDLAREAAAVRLQLAAVNATDWQLTPKAYYSDALSVAGASEKKVARIEKAMSEPQHQAVGAPREVPLVEIEHPLAGPFLFRSGPAHGPLPNGRKLHTHNAAHPARRGIS